MDFSPDILTKDEQAVFNLRALYSKCGYTPFKMSRFEEYELYAANRAFLPAGDIIAFTGAGGKLMALRPDVTLSIVKSIKGDDALKKLYYNENVYRTIGGELKERMQVGLECIGKIDTNQVAEVLMLAKQSLDILGKSTQLDVSHIGFLNGLLSSEKLTDEQKVNLTHCISEKNVPALRFLCADSRCSDVFCEKLIALTMLYGTYRDKMSELERISINDDTNAALNELKQLDTALRNRGITDGINIDFSVVNDITYYNGIVFHGYIEGVPSAVLSGGRYDELMHSFGKTDAAIGFAVYLDFLYGAAADGPGSIAQRPDAADDSIKMLSIALPKGRLGEKVYELLKKTGYECPGMSDGSRKLVLENAQRGVRYYWVKPSDVAIYVERGVADIGVVGKDTLLETRSDVYELLDLGFGKCRMCVAAKAGAKNDCHARTLRVATKFPNIAREYYAERGSDIDIIKLQGSVELAPLIGLSDVIVDLVETGKTLAENGMEPVETITDISARLISNKASYRFNHDAVTNLCKKIAGCKDD